MHATAGGNDNVSQLPEVPSFHVNVPGYEDCNFGMYVYGHSMYPTIETGSLVLCRRVRDKSVIMYGEIYLIRTDDYLMVKRLQKAKAGTVLCTSDNFEKRSPEFKRFEPFELDIDKIIDLYLVKGIIKKTQS
jgi:phage repressor protein C with HTH and peptisase S24 domain